MKARTSLILFACTVCAQQSSAPPAFEVASVKVAPPFTPGASPARGCSKADPALFRCNGITLKMLLMLANDMSWQQQRSYQIQGPDWLDTESYDVMAKVPQGEPAARIPAMLLTLLTERFRMKTHKESRILPAYELNVAKGGAKLKAVDVTKLPATLEPTGRPGAQRSLNSMPAGVLAQSSQAGGIRLARGNVAMEQLTDYLTGQFARPVIDNTGLKGTYAIDLAYVPEEVDSGAPMAVATLPQALQALGLRLDSKKAPIDVIVVDSANKIPTKN
jgi:uncharacterized protein (TIGR03435 family)